MFFLEPFVGSGCQCGEWSIFLEHFPMGRALGQALYMCDRSQGRRTLWHLRLQSSTSNPSRWPLSSFSITPHSTVHGGGGQGESQRQEGTNSSLSPLPTSLSSSANTPYHNVNSLPGSARGEAEIRNTFLSPLLQTHTHIHTSRVGPRTPAVTATVSPVVRTEAPAQPP